jgi:hypothetical protein
MADRIKTGAFHDLNYLSLHVHFLTSSTRDLERKTFEEWFTTAIASVALAWSKNESYRHHFDLAKPVLQLSATVSGGAHLIGKISPVPRNTAALDCDFWQASKAKDDSVYHSTVYPCRKFVR